MRRHSTAPALMSTRRLPEPEPDPEPEPGPQQQRKPPVPRQRRSPHARPAPKDPRVRQRCLVVSICLGDAHADHPKPGADDTSLASSSDAEEQQLAEENLAVYESAVTELLAEAGKADIIVDVVHALIAPAVAIFARFGHADEAAAALAMLARERDPLVRSALCSDARFEAAFRARAERLRAVEAALAHQRQQRSPPSRAPEPEPEPESHFRKQWADHQRTVAGAPPATSASSGGFVPGSGSPPSASRGSPNRSPSPRREWRLPADVDVEQLQAQIAALTAEQQRLELAVPGEGDAHRLTQLRQWVAAAQTLVDQHCWNTGSPARLSLSPASRSPGDQRGLLSGGQHLQALAQPSRLSPIAASVTRTVLLDEHRATERARCVEERDAALELIYRALLDTELRHVTHGEAACHRGARPQIRASALSRALTAMRVDRGVDRGAVGDIIALVSVTGDTGEAVVYLDDLLDKAYLGCVACLRRRIRTRRFESNEEDAQHLFTYIDAAGIGGVPLVSVDAFLEMEDDIVESAHSVVAQTLGCVAECLSRDAVDGQLGVQLTEAFEEVSGESDSPSRRLAAGSRTRASRQARVTRVVLNDEQLLAACAWLGVPLSSYQAVILVIALDAEGTGLISAQQMTERLLAASPSSPPTRARSSSKPVSLTGIWCAEGHEDGSAATIFERFQMYESDSGVLTGHQCDGEDPFTIIHGKVSGQGAWLSFDQRYPTGHVTVWRASLQRTAGQVVLADGTWSGEVNGTFFARKEDTGGGESDGEDEPTDEWNSGQKSTRPNWRARRQDPSTLDLGAFVIYLEDLVSHSPRGSVLLADAFERTAVSQRLDARSAVLNRSESGRALDELEEAQELAASALLSAQRLLTTGTPSPQRNSPGSGRRVPSPERDRTVFIQQSGSGLGMTFGDTRPTSPFAAESRTPYTPSLAGMSVRSVGGAMPTPQSPIPEGQYDYSGTNFSGAAPHAAMLEDIPTDVDLSGIWDLTSEDERGVKDKMYLVRAKTLPPANGMLRISVLGCPGLDSVSDREVAPTVELWFPNMADSFVSAGGYGVWETKRIQLTPAVLGGASRLGKHSNERTPAYSLGEDGRTSAHPDRSGEYTMPLMSWLEVVDSMQDAAYSNTISDEADYRFGPDDLHRLLEKAYTLDVNVYRCPHGANCKHGHTKQCLHMGQTTIDIREVLQDDWSKVWSGTRPLLPIEKQSQTVGESGVLVGDEHVVVGQSLSAKEGKIALMGKGARVCIEKDVDGAIPREIDEIDRSYLGERGVGVVKSVEVGSGRKGSKTFLVVQSAAPEYLHVIPPVTQRYPAECLRPLAYGVRKDLDPYSDHCGYVAEHEVLTELERRVDAAGVTQIRFERSPVDMSDGTSLRGWIPATNPNGSEILHKRSLRTMGNQWSVPPKAWPTPKELDPRVGHRGGRFLIEDMDTPCRREELLQTNPYGAVSLQMEYSAGAVIDTSANPVRILALPVGSRGGSVTHALHFSRAARGLTALSGGIVCHIYGSQGGIADGSFRVSELVSGGKELLLEQIEAAVVTRATVSSPSCARSPGGEGSLPPAGDYPTEIEQMVGNLTLVVGRRGLGSSAGASSGASTQAEGVTSHAEGWVGSATIPFAAVAMTGMQPPVNTASRQVVALRRGLVRSAFDHSRGGAQTLHFSCEAVAMPTSFDGVYKGPHAQTIDQTRLLSDYKDAAVHRYSETLERRLHGQNAPKFAWHATVLEAAGEGFALCKGTQVVQAIAGGGGEPGFADRTLRFEARQRGQDSFQLALRQATEALSACQAVELPDEWAQDHFVAGALVRQGAPQAEAGFRAGDRQLLAGWEARV